MAPGDGVSVIDNVPTVTNNYSAAENNHGHCLVAILIIVGWLIIFGTVVALADLAIGVRVSVREND